MTWGKTTCPDRRTGKPFLLQIPLTSGTGLFIARRSGCTLSAALLDRSGSSPTATQEAAQRKAGNQTISISASTSTGASSGKEGTPIVERA